MIGFFALAPLVQGKPPVGFEAAYGLLPIGVLSLLLVAAQATTAITSERDTGALDLLLVTDLSPREFIFGKLGGICYNTKEFLLPPLILAAKPGSQESADPVLPFLVVVGAFGFTIAAMLVPLLSEFDVAMGRTSGG